ncbi:hypothetical protein CJD36_003890 [Flavipsychrobacter stenotrophus]|uniref:Lipocalin-like domain-containing protein n=1 Tax=Flavipsychrobacter stenotrophus TaxID=2077091 RepID=A0A2S7T2B2_9BACT|nr:hypothetical protein [Flavipsychrobacter stenotrophus]PQJ12896.1 hypothetical protein CJD36_003890 [Flavipsychrobacter stenotrophus]
MKYIIPIIIIALVFAGCRNATTVASLKGKWILFAVAPTDTNSKDSTGNLGLALLSISVAINGSDTFDFSSDSFYTNKDTKGTYHTNGTSIYFNNNGQMDTFNYSMINDTLSLRSREKYLLQLKKIK